MTTDASGWFYESNGSRIGPINHSDLIGLIKNTAITGDTLVWQHGLGTAWRRLQELDWFNDAVPPPLPNTPPPLPVSHVDDRLVWALACVPLIGLVVEEMLKDSGVHVASDNRLLYLAYWITNAVLAYTDLARVKAAGHDNDRKIGFWLNFGALFLAPLYLYKRARLVGGRFHYFWAWIASLIVSLILASGGVGFGI